jgi:Polyketide cyclase / dehydrase and lipid transport
MAVIRREIMIARAPEDVWPAIGDPAAISTWFPGIVKAEVNGASRVITAASGLTMAEEIVTNDPVRRLFEYRITAPLLKNHFGSIEVTGAAGGRSLVRYETRCEPDTIALVIGGACGNALHELRRQLETESAPAAAEEA